MAPGGGALQRVGRVSRTAGRVVRRVRVVWRRRKQRANHGRLPCTDFFCLFSNFSALPPIDDQRLDAHCKPIHLHIAHVAPHFLRCLELPWSLPRRHRDPATNISFPRPISFTLPPHLTNCISRRRSHGADAGARQHEGAHREDRRPGAAASDRYVFGILLPVFQLPSPRSLHLLASHTDSPQLPPQNTRTPCRARTSFRASSLRTKWFSKSSMYWKTMLRSTSS